jgi:RHH-type transcriptional regulator, proline utilization regulon repressor / proline dehydrogenase / delta 1-pyrroline-5-carboxylate dehydrogenase
MKQGTATPDLRAGIREATYAPESGLVPRLVAETRLAPAERAAISAQAADLVRRVRAASRPTMMEAFLAEYGLSTEEGVGLMCLAEALLRVPDADTIDELIADKIEPSNWAAHLGHSSSPLVNAATWGLMLTGRVLDERPNERPGPAATLRGLIRRVGEPVVRTAVARSMKLMGRQFVLGETIEAAMARGHALEARGYTHSYDMLGEAARTDADAARYTEGYARAIAAIARAATGDVRTSPGISVKLSALHPRYEWSKRGTVMAELLPRAQGLARAAAKAGIGFTIDAEEADRLDLSLDVIEALLADPELPPWDGFGVVVQAYGRRALPVIRWLDATAERLGRRLMVRLVKGAYWDAEIKMAQERGVESFPVFTRKAATDTSYLACARRLLDARPRLYAQFGTHNAHTVAAVLAMAGDRDSFECQRLHGMGEALHEIVREGEGTRCRIYAPVGAHRDLLAYLVRRLLENGANSSFVNQLVNEEIAPETIAADPIAAAEAVEPTANPMIRPPRDLFAPRRNSVGWNVNEPASILPFLAAREAFRAATWDAAPILAGPVTAH